MSDWFEKKTALLLLHELFYNALRNKIHLQTCSHISGHKAIRMHVNSIFYKSNTYFNCADAYIQNEYMYIVTRLYMGDCSYINCTANVPL